MADFTDEFNDLANWDTSPANGLLALDASGYTTSADSLKITEYNGPALGNPGGWIINSASLANIGLDDRWYYTSFGLFIDNWTGLWNSDNTFANFILFVTASRPDLASDGFYVQADSNTTGSLWHRSTNICALSSGTWLQVEIALKRNTISSGTDFQVWLNNTSQLSWNDASSNSTPSRIVLIAGDDLSAPNTNVWIDSFNYDSNARIGPVSLAGAVNPSAGGSAPVNTVAPVVSGTAAVGSTLSCTTGTWTNSPTSYTYQWQRDTQGSDPYNNIGGATASTYLLVNADIGCHIRCQVTAHN